MKRKVSAKYLVEVTQYCGATLYYESDSRNARKHLIENEDAKEVYIYRNKEIGFIAKIDLLCIACRSDDCILVGAVKH